MGCFGGDREKGTTVTEEQKWDYITLSDFKSRSCAKITSYIWLWFLSIVGVAVYGADTFTAVNLLAFDKWSSQIDPAVTMSVTKWIFAGCILFSWVLCGYEWFRAIRAMRRGGVADSYLDPLAVTIQSERVYKGGQGWNRFLVFAELTKSKKGTDYIALFVYFQFKTAIRTVLAEGPRQVVNALTLYSVMKAKLLATGDNAASDGNTSVQQFFVNIKLLAEANDQQAVILSSMLFTLVIWVFSALCLFIAIVLYLLFLWHYIPSTDGSLSNYCRRKIDKRLERIVGITMKKEIQRQEAKMRKMEQMAIRNGQKPNAPRMPTLPTLVTANELRAEDFDLKRMDSASTGDTFTPQSNYSASTFSRSNTMDAMPRKPLQKQPTLPLINEDRRPHATRTDTQDSGYSDASNSSEAPLIIEASAMGFGEPGRLPQISKGDSYGIGHGPPPRSFTPMGRPPTAQGRGTPGPVQGRGPPGPAMPMRQNTGFSTGGPRGQTPVGMDMGRPLLRQDSDGQGFRGMPPPGRNNPGMMRSFTPAGPPPFPHPNGNDFAPFVSTHRGPSPGPEAYEMQVQHQHQPFHSDPYSGAPYSDPYADPQAFNAGVAHHDPLHRGTTPMQPPPATANAFGASIVRAGSAAPSIGEPTGGYRAFTPSAQPQNQYQHQHPAPPAAFARGTGIDTTHTAPPFNALAHLEGPAGAESMPDGRIRYDGSVSPVFDHHHDHDRGFAHDHAFDHPRGESLDLHGPPRHVFHDSVASAPTVIELGMPPAPGGLQRSATAPAEGDFEGQGWVLQRGPVVGPEGRTMQRSRTAGTDDGEGDWRPGAYGFEGGR